MSPADQSSEQDGLARAGDQSPGTQLFLFGLPGLGLMAATMVAAAWFGLTGLVLLAGLVAATGLVARAWAYLSLRAVSLTASLSASRAFPGDEVRLEVEIDNAKLLPLSWLEAEIAMPAALLPGDILLGTDAKGASCLRFATALGPYRKAVLRRTIACHRRGYHRIGAGMLRSSDVFGLFIKTRPFQTEQVLVVYPKIHPVTDLGLPAYQPLGAAKDPRRLFEDPGRPMALRPYTPETPFKAIAWSASARTGELMARQYEPTVSLDTALYLAVDSFDEKDDDLFEMAVSAIASIASHELENRRQVGVFVNGLQADGGGTVMIPASRAPGQQTLILERLARLERTAAEPFGAFLDATLPATAGRATLAIIASRFDAALLGRLRQLQERGRPVVLLQAGPGDLPDTSLSCRSLGPLTGRAAA